MTMSVTCSLARDRAWPAKTIAGATGRRARAKGRGRERAHLELVKAEHAALRGEAPRDLGQGVALVLALRGVLGSDGVLALEHVDHEGVEVDSTLARDMWWQGVVEQVHEHGLAGSYIAVQIEPLRNML